MEAAAWQRRAWRNRLQTVLLVLALVGISALAGALLLGENGLWLAVGASAAALVLEPAAGSSLTLRLYRATPIAPEAAPELWQLLEQIAVRAGLHATPAPYYVPSPVINAFAVGSRERAAIAMSDGLLRTLSPREVAGVLAHEVAHVAHGDLRVMNLADYVSRLTSLFSILGQALLLLALPWLFAGKGAINWPGFLLLVLSPHLALVVQLGLSRVREFDADLAAAGITGDPQGLASALSRIERANRSWYGVVMPGWGNPHPSWLRTHPASAERIRRLLALQGRSPALEQDQGAAALLPGGAVAEAVRRKPRWRFGGLWH